MARRLLHQASTNKRSLFAFCAPMDYGFTCSTIVYSLKCSGSIAWRVRKEAGRGVWPCRKAGCRQKKHRTLSVRYADFRPRALFCFVSTNHMATNQMTEISTSDRTHARTGPNTPQAQARDHTWNTDTRVFACMLTSAPQYSRSHNCCEVSLC